MEIHMKRRDFIKVLLASGLISPSLKALSMSFTPAITDEHNAVAFVEKPALDIGSNSSSYNFDYLLQDAEIRVIGVGGCGGNAVDYMIENGVQGVKFVAIDTNAEALSHTKAPTHLQIGTRITQGLGAAAILDDGRTEAEKDYARITEMLDGANLVFIVAGMGGSTGTGAAPVVAQIAKYMGIPIVAIVTKPFALDENRMRLAEIGIAELAEQVGSLIVVPNEKLIDVPTDDTTLKNAFHFSNCVMLDAVAGIAEAINVPGLTGVDFADIRELIREPGLAMVGAASAIGPNRAKIATERALSTQLMKDVNLSDAHSVLVTIRSDYSLTLKEYREVCNCVQRFDHYDSTMVSSVYDASMGDELRVTIVANGLG
jgi:cell division protein FtsZ